jgi:hypothetical protein
MELFIRECIVDVQSLFLAGLVDSKRLTAMGKVSIRPVQQNFRGEGYICIPSVTKLYIANQVQRVVNPTVGILIFHMSNRRLQRRSISLPFSATKSGFLTMALADTTIDQYYNYNIRNISHAALSLGKA